jgi:hypothetical protein
MRKIFASLAALATCGLVFVGVAPEAQAITKVSHTNSSNCGNVKLTIHYWSWSDAGDGRVWVQMKSGNSIEVKNQAFVPFDMEAFYLQRPLGTNWVVNSDSEEFDDTTTYTLNVGQTWLIFVDPTTGQLRTPWHNTLVNSAQGYLRSFARVGTDGSVTETYIKFFYLGWTVNDVDSGLPAQTCTVRLYAPPVS